MNSDSPSFQGEVTQPCQKLASWRHSDCRAIMTLDKCFYTRCHCLDWTNPRNACTLYQVFGYRGVILFPWLARVYDRDMPSKPPNTRSACVLPFDIHQLFFSIFCWQRVWISGKGFWTRTVLISPPLPGISHKIPFIANQFIKLFYSMAAGGVGKEVKGRTHTYYQVCRLLKSNSLPRNQSCGND